VFKATFNNISVISWQSVLLEETTDLSQVTEILYVQMWGQLYWWRKTGVPGENRRTAACH
jgi:hypothetical protein